MLRITLYTTLFIPLLILVLSFCISPFITAFLPLFLALGIPFISPITSLFICPTLLLFSIPTLTHFPPVIHLFSFYNNFCHFCLNNSSHSFVLPLKSAFVLLCFLPLNNPFITPYIRSFPALLKLPFLLCPKSLFSPPCIMPFSGLICRVSLSILLFLFLF